MALSAAYRWIVCGSLNIRKRANAPAHAPTFNIDDIMRTLTARHEAADAHRFFGAANSRVMWCSDIGTTNQYHYFLAQTGDRNAAGVSFFNFDTHQSRDVEKEENEGGHYSSHILLSRDPGADGRYIMLIEKVPGISMSSLKDHFTWNFRDPNFAKQYITDNGEEKQLRPVVEIDGYQSKTIGDALKTGVLQDIEFVSTEEEFPDGLDEEGIIREIKHEAKWDIRRRVTEEEAGRIFGRLPAFLHDFRRGRADARMFLRIKTANNHIKRTEMREEGGDFLEQAFVQNEVVSNFHTPLPPRYETVRRDMLEKMVEIAENIQTP